MMKKFVVYLYFKISKQNDLVKIVNVHADNSDKALVLAKQKVRMIYPQLNFAKLWFWSSEGKPIGG